jgi:hypothetical protein
MKKIITVLLILCAANVSAQQVILKQTVVYPPFSVKYSASDAIPDSMTCSTATTTAPGLMSPLHVGQINTASATNITQGETIKAQGKALDSIKTVLSTTPVQSAPGYGEVTSSTYTVTAADAGKHIVFRAACTITVTGLQPGQRVSLSSQSARLTVTGSGIHSKLNYRRIQSGGCASVIGENGGFSLSGDLSN